VEEVLISVWLEGAKSHPFGVWLFLAIDTTCHWLPRRSGLECKRWMLAARALTTMGYYAIISAFVNPFGSIA